MSSDVTHNDGNPGRFFRRFFASDVRSRLTTPPPPTNDRFDPFSFGAPLAAHCIDLRSQLERSGFQKGADVLGQRKSSCETKLWQRPSRVGKDGGTTLLTLSGAVELIFDEGDERVPLSVDLNATKPE